MTKTKPDVGRWVLVGCFAVMLAGYASTLPVYDFIEYWASAHELAAGRNPYSLDGTLHVERALGWHESYSWTMMNPPWALPLIAPLGLAASYRLAYFVWAAVLAVLICLATAAVLKLYSPSRPIFPSESFLSQGLLACTFAPAVFSVAFGQINSLLLVGLAGFLWFENKRRYALAGACLAIAAVKPQILFLVWAALLLDSIRRRQWQTIAAFFTSLAGLTAAATLMRSEVVLEYVEFTRSGYSSRFAPALGGILRILSGHNIFALQFLAPVAALTWFAFYWRKHRRNWIWLERIPLLLTVSVLTTAYGWMLDQVVLLIPVIAIAACYAKTRGRIPRQVIALYAATNVAIVGVLLLSLKMPMAGAVFMFPIAPIGALWGLSRMRIAKKGLAEDETDHSETQNKEAGFQQIEHC